MSGRQRLRHLIIFLPGIMGSALRKGDQDLWALSGIPLWQYARALWDAFGPSVSDLGVTDTDWRAEDLGDGVVAIEIIKDLHSVPPLIEHSGYSRILSAIPQAFDGVVTGRIDRPQDNANFYPFPYDWRRDNRATALKLQRFIDEQLPRWREWSKAHDAQVILVAHSMGGLVARYYMEVLGGWKHCRGLLTIGTPHRGSLKALKALSEGIAIRPHVLNPVVRALTSAYQLLPVYEAVKVDGAYVRPADTDGIPHVIKDRAHAARAEFHEAIRTAAIANRKEQGYELRTIPWVGVRQDTFQSAFVEDGKLITSYLGPPGVDDALAHGDATVPRISAIPSDWSEHEARLLPRFSAEQHGWLTNNDMTLQPLLETLVQLVAAGGQSLYGKQDGVRPAINLRVEPAVERGEPVAVRVALADAGVPASLTVRLDSVARAEQRRTQQVTVAPGEPAEVLFEGLSPGLYRVEVKSRGGGRNVPLPVHSVVEVADVEG